GEAAVDAHLDPADPQVVRAEAVHYAQVQQALLQDVRLDHPRDDLDPDGETAGPLQQLVRPDLVAVDDDVVDGGDASRRADLELRQDALGQRLRRHAGLAALDQVLGALA